MVKRFIYLMIITALLVPYLIQMLSLPRFAVLIPDLLSAIAAVIVIARVSLDRFQSIDAKYVIVCGLLLFNFVAGVVSNELAPGVVVAGLRIYFKAMPFFFLPMLVKFDDEDLRRQLLLIVAILLIQLPLGWQQRMATAAKGGGLTGDLTYGTIMLSGYLTILMCCAASVVLALYLKKLLSLRTMLLLLVMILGPTMINETKISIFIIPLALLVPAVLLGEGSSSALVKRIFAGLILLGVFGTAFVVVYDYFMVDRWGYGLFEFFTRPGRAEAYLDSGAQVGSTTRARQVDAIRIASHTMASDPVTAAFGLGMGNASQSSLGQGFTGHYFVKYGLLIGPNFGLLIWETGFFGVFLVFVLLYLILRDTLVARHAGGFTGAFAVGWTGVMAIMGLCMFYTNTISSETLSYLFWFYCGIVCAAAMRVKHARSNGA